MHGTGLTLAGLQSWDFPALRFIMRNMEYTTDREAAGKPLLFVYNPHAGSSKILESLNALLSQVVASGRRVEVHPTQGPRDATEKVLRDRDQYARIIAAGGDGLFHEVVNGLAGCDIPVGYVPVGTVNDFASTHHLSFDPQAAMKTALEGEVHTVDAGSFNGEVFAYVAAVGIGTQAAWNTSQDMKKRFGTLAYVASVIQSIDFTHWENNSARMAIETDDRSFAGDFTYGMVCNTFSVGGSDILVPNEANLSDGLLEYLFIRRPMNLTELNQILRSLASRDFSSPFFEWGQTRALHVQSEAAHWTLDGEYGGEITDAEIRCLPGFLHLVKDPKPA